MKCLLRKAPSPEFLRQRVVPYSKASEPRRRARKLPAREKTRRAREREKLAFPCGRGGNFRARSRVSLALPPHEKKALLVVYEHKCGCGSQTSKMSAYQCNCLTIVSSFNGLFLFSRYQAGAPMTEGVEVALDPSELELDPAAMQAR